MTIKEDVPEDVECAETLLILNRSKPKPEEYKGLQLCILNDAERRIFLRRNKSSTITTRSSTVMESMLKEEDLKVHIHDRSLTESPTKVTRNRHNLPPMFPPMERQSKKAKRSTGAFFSKTREPTPEWLIRLMRRKNGGDHEDNSKKIINKELTKTDVHANNNRLSIPVSDIVELNFLSRTEESIIEEDANKFRKIGVNAILVGSNLSEHSMSLRLWEMGNCPLYNLVTGWNKVVKDCRLKVNAKIRLWSFHANDQLYFALVPLSEK